MSRSAGPGSPISFMCSKERAIYYSDCDRSTAQLHRVIRTGRTKPYRSPRGSARGVRTLMESHEYTCSCGHTGWSSHKDILRYPVETMYGDDE